MADIADLQAADAAVVIYEGADHGFVHDASRRPTAPTTPPTPGPAPSPSSTSADAADPLGAPSPGRSAVPSARQIGA